MDQSEKLKSMNIWLYRNLYTEYVRMQCNVFFKLFLYKIQFCAYQDDPEKTAATIRGDFYVTGDRGIMDEDGYYWFVGRSDDVITSAG